VMSNSIFLNNLGAFDNGQYDVCGTVATLTESGGACASAAL
jgi:hypothetical protein